MLTSVENTSDYQKYIVSKAYYAGQWHDGGNQTIAVYDPATGRPVGQAASLTDAQVTDAITSAQNAQPGWAALSHAERGAILRRCGELLRENELALAQLITAEQGKPLAESIGEIQYSASYLFWYAEEAKRIPGETIASHLPRRRMTVEREPIGVVAAITPWNFPSAMLARKMAAALAAGCTVVALPSSATPFSALALAKIGEEAGIPPGVFSVLTGRSRAIVPILCSDTRVRAVSFTGSTSVGKEIASLSASTVKRLCLELGGHAPFIVFDDADLDKAVADAIDAKFATSGQDCLAANRIFVQAGIYDRFVARFVEATSALKVGNGFAADVKIGPLINSQSVGKVDEQVKDAISKGARLQLGGGVHDAGPLFYQPTVLSDITPDMLIMSEETFGPVAGISRFDNEDEVIVRANDSEYGLMAYVQSTSQARTERVSRQLAYGMVGINTAKVTGAPIPFGGIKQSGMGREGSHHGLHEFTNLKYVCAAF